MTEQNTITDSINVVLGRWFDSLEKAIVETVNKAGENLVTRDELQITNNSITELSKEQRKVNKRMDWFEYQQEITRKQADNIKNKVKSLARECVGYPSNIYGVCIQDIYRYLRDYYNLANAVGDTEKQYYKDVIEGLGTYKDSHFDKQKLIDHKKELDSSRDKD